MRAIVFDKTDDASAAHLQLQEDFPSPKPGKDDALIKPTLMGICATDVEICKGYMGFTGILGHEFVGTVEQVGSSKHKKWIGKRVVGMINCVCGTCDMCKAGLREHCRDRTVLGISGKDGCFAQEFTLPVHNLVAVPKGVDDDHAVFAEPLAAALQILRQLTVEGRPYITVLGDGKLGLLCAQVLTTLNATVRLVGKHLKKIEMCEKWGVKHRLLHDVGLRGDQDIVIDCTGSAQGIVAAMQMVRPRGKIVMKTTVATNDKAGPIDLSPLVINEIQLIGSRCGPMSQALAALEEQSVDVLSLISKRMKLSDGVKAIDIASQGGDTLKVLIEP